VHHARTTLLLLALLVPIGARAACSCGFGDGAYTLTTITIDGTFTDWNSVLADSHNVACDALSASGDPDNPTINNSGRDLIAFAQTWNATSVFLYTERAAGNAAQQQFLYYADSNSNGYMETGEFVINASWSNSGVTLTKYTYNASAVGGDPMVNGSNMADGYTLPGTLSGASAITGGAGATNGSTLLEFNIPWAELGVAAGTGVTFHVSSLSGSINSSKPPGNINDNMSGCGGGLGGTTFASFSFAPNRSLSGVHGATVCAAHAIMNTGNASDIFNITTSALPSQVTSVALYADVNNNGVYDSGTDTLLTDSPADAGSVIDTGSLAVLATKNILACYTIGNVNSYTPSGSGAVTLTASSVWNASVNHGVTDTITVTLVPSPLVTKGSTAYSDPYNNTTNPKRIPGGYVTYAITITNNGGGAIDANSVVITDLIPAGVSLFVNTIGGTPAGPVSQSDGTVACGLDAAALTKLYSTIIGVTAGSPDTSFTATPVADGNGVDSSITAVRIKPSGTFVGQSAPTAPSCTWRYRVRVK